jgi:hypothetical protein
MGNALWKIGSFISWVGGYIQESQRDLWFKTHYADWQERRFKIVEKELGSHFSTRELDPLVVLELGAGHGEFSKILKAKGHQCHVAEARTDHLDFMRKLNFDGYYQFDGDYPEIPIKSVDVLIHFGLLYHLANPLEHLDWCLQNIDFSIMFLETEVFNHPSPDIVFRMKERGYDQAFNGIGGRPTSAGISRILDSRGLKYKRIDLADLDSDFHDYSWSEKTFPASWKPGLRRFYVIYGDSV